MTTTNTTQATQIKSLENRTYIQVLISKDKKKYILLAERDNISNVVTNFEYTNGEMKPSLVLDINRIIRTKNLLKGLPAVFIMNADGKKIQIDAVSKILEFEGDISGIVHFRVKNKEEFKHEIINICERIPEEKQYVVIEDNDDETEFQPNSLKVLPIMLHKSATVCIVDAIEKILHCPVLNPKTGFIGVTNTNDYGRLLTYQNIWPELDIEFTVKKHKIYISSQLMIETLQEYDIPVYVKIHRNFGGSDLQINVTHKFMQNYGETNQS